jgi:hypothetical protein
MDATAAIFSPGDSSNGRYYIDNSKRDEMLKKDSKKFVENYSTLTKFKVTFQ